MKLTRSSGLLLHPTSLPGGRLGPEAYEFVDWLAAAGQTWWQLLPLGPPDKAGSPYKASSAFAGWRGLLAEPDASVSASEERELREREAYWIDDWAEWAGDGALADQVRFQREWLSLREYAAGRGVRLIGDLPIYVAEGSADVQAHPELFQHGAVAGAPPDPFSEIGQLWGNPLYDWAALRAQGYRWWVERFRRNFELFDLTRIDHFRAFVSYWSVPAEDETAMHGSWRRGPGAGPFEATRRELGELPLIAEDLGRITAAVLRLRDELGLPGMVVLQFAFSGSPSNPYLVENHPEHSVAYTGTHDHDTVVGWWESRDERTRRAVARELERVGVEAEDEIHWTLIRLVFASRARIALLPAQDVLGLGNDARMNVPGSEDGNWRWRLEPGQLTPELAERLRVVTEASGRLGPAQGLQ